MRLADRVAATKASGIRKIFDLAADLKDPVNLSIGEPDFAVPQPVRDAACDAIRAGKSGYTPTQGNREFRRALLEKLGKYADAQVLVTSAVSGALTLAYLALLNEGDEALIPDPYFISYKQLAHIVGATPVYYNTYPKWKADPAEIEKLITPRTRVFVLGSPANPTGAVYTREELTAIAAVLKKHDIVALSDEIYSAFCYDCEFVSFGEVYENTLVMGGFSKSHALTGWRLGYAAGPAELIEAMTKFQQFTFVCAPAPVQAAGIAALKTDTSALIAVYQKKRDLIYNGLIDAGYEVEKPDGAFYILPKVPRGSDVDFVAECVKNNLLVIPGSVFSERATHFRIAYTAPEEKLREGLEILRRLR